MGRESDAHSSYELAADLFTAGLPIYRLSISQSGTIFIHLLFRYPAPNRQQNISVLKQSLRKNGVEFCLRPSRICQKLRGHHQNALVALFYTTLDILSQTV